jgi:hypothetical protein
MENAVEVAVWICVITFGVTAAITLLGMTGVLKMEKQYLDPLFKALILELVVIIVAAVGKSMNRSLGNELKVKGDEFAFVKLTSPIEGVGLTPVGDSSTIWLSGAVYKLNEKQRLEGYAVSQLDSVIRLDSIWIDKSDANVFHGRINYPPRQADTLRFVVGVLNERDKLRVDPFVVRDEVRVPLNSRVNP